MNHATELTQMTARIPPQLKTWLEEQARLNASSANSEIVRSIRERMEREAATRQPQSTA
jgi:hypothetical protein